jgi:hypothetical protein
LNAPNRPGLRKASASRDVAAVVAAKAEFRSLCVELGLAFDDGTYCNRGATRYIEAHNDEHHVFDMSHESNNRESTVRGWLHPTALNRCPPEAALEFLRCKVQERREQAVGGGSWGALAAAALRAVR